MSEVIKYIVSTPVLIVIGEKKLVKEFDSLNKALKHYKNMNKCFEIYKRRPVSKREKDIYEKYSDNFSFIVKGESKVYKQTTTTQQVDI